MGKQLQVADSEKGRGKKETLYLLITLRKKINLVHKLIAQSKYSATKALGFTLKVKNVFHNKFE